jgi:hypothetical protein
MSLIEQAAKRLEQLRKAGVEVYSPAGAGEAPTPDSDSPPASTPGWRQLRP